VTERTILLVEDNADDAELMVRAFRSVHADAHIRVAGNGGEAIEALLGLGDRPLVAPPALVLLDLKLPGMDGFDVLRCIRGDPRTSNLPVVILTSSTEPADITNAYALGANSYLRKPMVFRDLLTLAKHVAAYWLDLNELPRHSHSAVSGRS
jgi:two-component system, response regulator